MATELPTSIQCEECLDELGIHPGAPYAVVSRPEVLVIHNRHRPMHPNQVGPRRRKEAAKAYAEWEAKGPYA